MDFSKIKYEDNKYILNSYKRFDVALKSGKGSTFYDVNDKKYIDFSSGIAVNTFGIADSKWVKAITKQAKTLQHVSNLYYSLPQIELAKILCRKTKMKKVFFANSGAEANEGAIKAARKYSFDKYGENRFEIITLKNSFHGRTMATLSATGQDSFHKFFNPFLEGFKYATANDITSVKSLVSKATCAIMLETIQGEGGVLNLEEEFLKEVEKICKKNDLVFIIDEVQTGNGRTGYFYSYMEYNLKPNIVTTAKGLGGGLPIGAILFDSKLENTIGYGEHGSTFGGNPIAAAGAVSVLKRINDNFLEEVKKKSKIIFNKLSTFKKVGEISGKGLMIGFKTSLNADEVVNLCLDKGLLVLKAKDKIRILPPLNISHEELEEGLSILEGVLK